MKDKWILVFLMVVSVVVVALVLPRAISHGQREMGTNSQYGMPIYEYEEDMESANEHIPSEESANKMEDGSKKEESAGYEGFVSTEDESGRNASSLDIQNLELDIVGMAEDVRSSIRDYDGFLYAIKEYFYRTGVMETKVTCLGFSERQMDENLMGISMQVESMSMQRFDVVFDENTDSYYIRLN